MCDLQYIAHLHQENLDDKEKEGRKEKEEEKEEMKEKMKGEMKGKDKQKLFPKRNPNRGIHLNGTRFLRLALIFAIDPSGILYYVGV